MNLNITLKRKIYQETIDLLTSEMKELERQLKLLKESDEGEEKSSAGDKYETQREMNQQSRNLLENRLQLANKRIHYLSGLTIKEQKVIENLALVKLSSGIFWITFGIGSIQNEEEKIHLISTDSPLFLAISGKNEGDVINFRGQNIKVIEIV